jgi:hypothetical protein
VTLEIIMKIMQYIAAIIGTFIVAGGGFGLLIYNIFKFFGEKWLNSKFEERLEAYKHEQQKELERLKFKINALMDRTTKLHQREFDVLPEAWSRLTEAHGKTAMVAWRGRTYPDLDKIDNLHLEEILEKSPLPEWQKAELRSSSKKREYYIEAMSLYELDQASAAYFEFYIYLQKNSIFVKDPIKSKFKELDQFLFAVLTEQKTNKVLMQKVWDKVNELNQKGDDLLKSLERDIQERLWNSQATEL